jgi:hypothetical protein
VVAALPKSPVLKDGRESKMLADARAFIFALPGICVSAVGRGKGRRVFRQSIAAQLNRALKAEELI